MWNSCLSSSSLRKAPINSMSWGWLCIAREGKCARCTVKKESIVTDPFKKTCNVMIEYLMVLCLRKTTHFLKDPIQCLSPYKNASFLPFALKLVKIWTKLSLSRFLNIQQSHRVVNCDVVTHDKKMRLAIFKYLAIISKEYKKRYYFSFKITSLAVLSQKGERREPIRFGAHFSKNWNNLSLLDEVWA